MLDGKKRKIVRDLTGRTFGYLTMLRPSEVSAGHGKRALWVARCECGEELVVPTDGFRSNRKPSPTSCGCMTKELRAASRRTHGMSGHKAFAVWRSMVDRCTLPSHHAWKNYGGRGISVCEPWLTSFAAFWADMGPSYSPGLTLDRERNNEGYSPQNCRWVDRKTQARNTRYNRMIDTPAGHMLVVEASELSGIGATTLLYRLQAGWSADQLFLPPSPSNRRVSTT